MHSTEKPETDLSGPAETATSARWRTTRVGAQIALIAVACWAYWPTISGIVDSWVSNPDYSHGLLVGPIALLFMWARRDACPRLSPTHCWPGLLLLGAAALLRYVAARFYLPNLDGWSIPLWLGGIVWLFQGRQRFRWMLPSLAFLWFATPLPGTIEVLLSTPLQHIAAIVSGWSLRLIGQPAVVEGTTILLNEHVLDIERACSGLRMFYGILAMAFSCAVLLRMRGWMAFALLIATIPVAMIANVCRIVVTALLLQQYSSEAASRFSHDFAGVLMIPLAVVLFIAYASWLRTTVSRFHSEDRGRFASWITLWALAILVSLAGLVGWGQYQQQNMLGILRQTSSRYEREERWGLAASYLQRYLQIDDSGDEVFEKFAELSFKSANSRRARLRVVSLLRSAWQRNPTRIDLAEQAARTAHDVGEYATALTICEDLFAIDVPQATHEQLKLLYAEAMSALLNQPSSSSSYSWEQLSAALDSARQVAGAKIDYSEELARLWHEKLLKPSEASRALKAHAVMCELVANQPANPMAWLARHRYLVKYGLPENTEAQTDTTESDIERAVGLASAANEVEQSDIYSAAAKQAEQAGEVLRPKSISSVPSKRARSYRVPTFCSRN